MCGIVGYLGTDKAKEVLLEGLKRLEYRGYDSAGIVLRRGNSFDMTRSLGEIALLKAEVTDVKEAYCGIAHTRWATHGEPSVNNAHPHMSYDSKFCLVHNGIIENYEEIKTFLENHDIYSKSDTDTEVLCNLISFEFSITGSIKEAIIQSMKQIEGSYAVALSYKETPDILYAFKKESPLIVGKKDEELFIASDAIALSGMATEIYYLNQGSIAVLEQSKELIFYNEKGELIKIEEEPLKSGEYYAEKGGYEDFMLKEIFEQSEIVKKASKGVICDAKHEPTDICDVVNKHNITRMVMIGCGTSWHAALIGKYLIEKVAQIPVTVEYASEFRYRSPVIGDNDLVIAISQSGETADTLAALRLAKEKGAIILGLCNVLKSTVVRESDYYSMLMAGHEVGVASTKAFTAQYISFYRMAMRLSASGTEEDESQLNLLPHKIEKLLERNEEIREIAKDFTEYPNILYIGRGIHYPIALEGALKLKEISYMHAEGYAGGEMKHGPIALVDEHFPTVAVVADKHSHSKMLINVKETQTRKGIILAVARDSDSEISNVTDTVIRIPDTHDHMIGILSTIALQLFAYHVAKIKGRNVDRPRNLAKSVTVE